MIREPIDVLSQFPVRKTKQQKQAFRDAVAEYAESLGYVCDIEKGGMGSRNVVIGDPEHAETLVTAHYDTPARMLFPNLITPCNLLTFIAYQIFMVGVFFAAAFAVGIPVWYLTHSGRAAFLAGYIVYFGLLFLMMYGPANPSNANDNTSGVVTVLETLRTMPENQREKVCFVLFDLEEAGLIGSASYRKKHKKASADQIVLNLDCVGDGDEIVFYPVKKLCQDRAKMLRLCGCVGRFGAKTITVCNKGFRVYPSDQKNFPYGVGIAAFRRKKGVGLYCAKIHTAKDTNLDQTNVNILRAALTSLISGTAAQ